MPVTKKTNASKPARAPVENRRKHGKTGAGQAPFYILYTPNVRSPLRHGAQVAQLVEHRTENAGVGGSNPPLGTITFPSL